MRAEASRESKSLDVSDDLGSMVCKRLVYDSDSLELCDSLGGLSLDMSRQVRQYIGVNTSLYAAELILSKLCLGCDSSCCVTCSAVSSMKP